MKTKIPITVHPGIFQVLGKQLVVDSLRALSELAKNSYDADATEVIIELIDAPERSIRVTDNGTGMTPHQIRKGWLQLGTPLKRRRKTSPGLQRPLSGSMGIGRLAAFSLGETIILETGFNSTNWYKVTLKLPKLLKAADFENLTADAEPMKEPPYAKGTQITIKNLKWWPENEEVESLRLRLALIRSPAGADDFKLIFRHGGLEKELIPEEELPEAPLTVAARIDDKGSSKFEVKASPNLYLGESEIRPNGWIREGKSKWADLRGVELRARWYPRGDRPAGAYWRLTIDKGDLEGIAGIRCYRDVMRVLPYGEPGDDWLGLEARYVAAGATERHPRPRGLVGWVVFSRQHNGDLIDTANREGLVANEPYRHLRQFAREAFEFVAEVRKGLEPAVPKKRLVTETGITRAIKQAQALRPSLKSHAADLNRLDTIESFLLAVRDEYDLVTLYRDRLTAGNMVRLVLHDVGVSLSGTATLVHDAAQEECAVETHTRALPVMDDIVPRLVSAYQLLRGAGKAGAYRRARTDIKKTAETLAARFHSTLRAKFKIRVMGKEVFANVREADIFSVFVNLLHNAITADEFEQSAGKEFPQEREIILRVRAKGATLVLECEDNGPGLPKKPEGWIWQPFNSTRKGGGSGLGLWIVADATAWYGGTKEARPSREFKSGALFRIELPDVVIDEK